jgi:hypothetical protein
LRRAGVLYFRIYDLRSTYATRLSAGGVADEFVTQLLRQGDAKVFKKYSQMKLQMKRRLETGEDDGRETIKSFRISENLVGARGFEPPTPCAQGRCATRLRYAPTFYSFDSKSLPSILPRAVIVACGKTVTEPLEIPQPWQNSEAISSIT